jgi:hypothetical protein
MQVSRLWRSGWELAASEFGGAARRAARDDFDVVLAEMPSPPASSKTIRERCCRSLSAVYGSGGREKRRLATQSAARVNARNLDVPARPFHSCDDSRLKDAATALGARGRIKRFLCASITRLYPTLEPPAVPTVV